MLSQNSDTKGLPGRNKEYDRHNNFPSNRIDLETSFAGDNGYSFITFQVDLVNRSEHTVFIDDNRITLRIDSREEQRDIFHPIPKRDIIESLEEETKNISNQKKLDTAEGALYTGLEVLSGISATGNLFEGLLFGSLNAVDMISRRRVFNKAENSIEEEIDYHAEYTLDRVMIDPGESATFDVHFERPIRESAAELEINCADHSYLFDYQLELKEMKVRK